MFNIGLLKAGSESEFKKLFESQGERILNTAFYLLGNTEDAEDITQEVFKSVFTGINSFKEEADIKTWIYRITINKCNEFVRKQNRKKRKGILLSLWNVEVIPTADTPEMAMILTEEEIQLWNLINKLPDKQRVALTLFALDELSYQEIANSMSLSVSAVESLLFRARNNLKNKKYGG